MSAKKKVVFKFDERSYEARPSELPAGSELAPVSLLVCAPQTCEWHRWESGQYETKCDNVFEFTHEGIKENDFKYCPFCGGSITEKQANVAHKPSGENPR